VASKFYPAGRLFIACKSAAAVTGFPCNLGHEPSGQFRQALRHGVFAMLNNRIAEQQYSGHRNLGHGNNREALWSLFLCPPFLCHSLSDRIEDSRKMDDDREKQQPNTWNK
jgi:hypothetical protein